MARPAINSECTSLILTFMEGKSHDMADKNLDSFSNEVEDLLYVPLYGAGPIFGRASRQLHNDHDEEGLSDNSQSLGKDGQRKASIPDLLVSKEDFDGSAAWDFFASEDAFHRGMVSISGLVALYRTNPVEHAL